MLKLNGREPASELVVAFDQYVPFSARTTEGKKGLISYWRAVPSEHSLFEVQFESLSGRVVALTLTLLERSCVAFRDGQAPIQSEIVSIGEPFVSDLALFTSAPMHPGQTTPFDQRLSLFMTVFSDSLLLEVGVRGQALKRYIKAGRLLLGVNEADGLTSILISPVSQSELQKLKLALS